MLWPALVLKNACVPQRFRNQKLADTVERESDCTSGPLIARSAVFFASCAQDPNLVVGESSPLSVLQ